MYREKLADLDSFLEFLRSTANDLEAPAQKIAPVIGNVVGEIAHQKRVLLARMSGSGATCFGIFANDAAAQIAASSLASKHPDWWVIATALTSERGRPARNNS